MASTTVETFAVEETAQPRRTLDGHTKERPPAPSCVMIQLRCWPARGLVKVELVTAMGPRANEKSLQAEASNVGVAVSATVQRLLLKPAPAWIEPSGFWERLPPAAAPPLL